jgi:ABC-type bacteriocin/lantibiotic exporter with double-glycine peptidase domain
MRIPYLTAIGDFYRIFNRYAGYRMALFVVVTVFTNILAGVGISFVLPLLNYTTGDPESADSYSKFIFSLLTGMGLSVSLGALLGLLIAVFCLKALLLFLQTRLRVRISTYISLFLQSNLLEKIERMSYQRFTFTSTGYLSNLMTIEVGRAVATFKQYSQLIAALASAGVFIAYSACLNWQLTTIAATAGILLAWPGRLLASRIKALSAQLTRQNATTQNLLLQVINNFKYLKATAGFSRISPQLSDSIRRLQQYGYRGNLLSSIPTYLIEPISVIFLALWLYYSVGILGGTLIENIVAIFFLDRAMRSIFRLHAIHQQFSHQLGALLEIERARVDLSATEEPDGSQPLTRFDSEIRLENIDFSYGDRPILRQVSLSIGKNECIGIVGESGSGKTTLFDLLTGLLEPDRGNITCDGIAYHSLTKSSLRSMYGYVTQEPVIFDGSFRDNIALWAPDASGPAIEAAARAAFCEEFIVASEDGYDTQIGDKGIRLSGGQKQRLAIAREIFWNPQLLILDEATSSLDSESERFIRLSLKKLIGEKTILIIAHRLATVRDCDRIYVLKNGEITESGTWEQLIAKEDSQFHRLAAMQGLLAT